MAHAAVPEHRAPFHYPAKQARELPSMFICTLSKTHFHFSELWIRKHINRIIRRSLFAAKQLYLR